VKQHQEIFQLLSEGSPNSLGKVLEVLDYIKSNEFTLEGLLDLYEKEDRFVSMRISNILKRLWREDASNILPYVNRLIDQAKSLKNPTFRWTLAQIYDELSSQLSLQQQEHLLQEIQRNLELGDDWIMLSQSLKALQKALKHHVLVMIPNQTLTTLTHHSSKVVRAQTLKITDILTS
jgi:hypothetical protein